MAQKAWVIYLISGGWVKVMEGSSWEPAPHKEATRFRTAAHAVLFASAHHFEGRVAMYEIAEVVK